MDTGALAESLQRKIGPLPAWGWAVAGSGAFLAVRFFRTGKVFPTATAPAVVAPTQPDDPTGIDPVGGTGGVGGIGGVGGAGGIGATGAAGPPGAPGAAGAPGTVQIASPMFQVGRDSLMRLVILGPPAQAAANSWSTTPATIYDSAGKPITVKGPLDPTGNPYQYWYPSLGFFNKEFKAGDVGLLGDVHGKFPTPVNTIGGTRGIFDVMDLHTGQRPFGRPVPRGSYDTLVSQPSPSLPTIHRGAMPGVKIRPSEMTTPGHRVAMPGRLPRGN